MDLTAKSITKLFTYPVWVLNFNLFNVNTFIKKKKQFKYVIHIILTLFGYSFIEHLQLYAYENLPRG